jgi:hypothetical protein
MNSEKHQHLKDLIGKLCVVSKAAWLFAAPLDALDGGLAHSSYSNNEANREVIVFPDMPFVILEERHVERSGMCFPGDDLVCLKILLGDKITYICSGASPIEFEHALKQRKKDGE